LASAAGCAPLTRQILPSHMHSSSYTDVGLALAQWNGDNLSPPSSPNKGKQKAWDLPKVHACFEHLVSTSPSPVSRARLLGAASKESSAWLNAPPVSSLGLRIDDDTISICVGLRLGVPLCRPISAFTVVLQLTSTPFTASAVLKVKDDIHVTMP
jgi:hypothetical protein